MVKLNQEAPTFKAQSMHNKSFKEVSLEDYKGKFVILFFYPADYTFVCPTELEDMAENYTKIQELGGEILSISTDTHFVHLAWHNESPSIGKIKFPMVADPTHQISIAYDVLRDNQGVADRATIIIDPDGSIKAIEITDEPIGRNADELLRKLEALKYSRENPGYACPAKWKLGSKTLKPGEDLVGKL
jgi:peroxiredoxin (alkyl hydroperoxide reductase subunit C)